MDDVTGWATSAGIGLAIGLALLYLILRGTAWSPGRGDPVRAVRTHAMVTALIALFASGTAGLSGLATAEEYEVFGNGAFPITTEVDGEITREIISSPLPPLPWYEALGIVAGSVLGLVLVYAVSQYTWPRQTGAVRKARLSGRRAVDLLPRYLTGVVSVVALAAVGMVTLSWSAPAVEAQQIDDHWEDEFGGGYSSSFSPGSRAGEDVAPWMLLAVVLAAAGFVVVLRTVAHRPALSGLHPQDDDLVRRITVNRALRTVAVMLLGIGGTAYNAWTGAQVNLATRRDEMYTEPLLGSWLAAVAFALTLALLFWRSPAVSELGTHTVTTDFHDAGRVTSQRRAPRVPAQPGTALAVVRLRLDGATMAWIAAVTAGAVVGMFMLVTLSANPGAVLASRDQPGWPLLWLTVPFALALLILGVFEFAVRRGHTPADEPATTGKPSRWPLPALGLAVLLATVWCVLCLTSVVPQTGLAAALAVATVVLAAAALALTRLALRRPPLGHATAEQDAVIRTGGANRMLAVGAAGIFTITGAACLAGVQVWHGFISTAALDLGMNELPDGLLVTRTVTLVALACLVVFCLIAPAPEVPREAEAHQPVSA